MELAIIAMEGGVKVEKRFGSKQGGKGTIDMSYKCIIAYNIYCIAVYNCSVYHFICIVYDRVEDQQTLTCCLLSSSYYIPLH